MKTNSSIFSFALATTRVASLLCLCCFLPLPLGAIAPADLPVPGQIGDVICASDSSQSYALYLPSAYVPGRNWPIIYFFDPGGRGRRPLELYKELADKYGFIFAASNNSRNFSPEQSKSVNAIWLDTHTRLALEAHRIYTSGFSGGARIAGAMALGCPKCEIAGVVAHGAGYPSDHPPADKLLYFFALGNEDFNWPEIMAARADREEHRQAYRVRVFSGTHQWAPANIMEDALQWLTLKSMQAGDLKPDAAFLERLLQQTQAQAAAAQNAKDATTEFDAYRLLALDFTGLRDTTDASTKLSALKQSPAYKAARKQERDQINEQFNLEREVSPKLTAYREGSEPDPAALAREIVQAMARLKEQAAHAKNENKRLVFSRAFSDLWVEGIENGQQELAARHFEKAETCFDLMRQIQQQPWPYLLLAQAHLGAGKKKEALRDLQQSADHGLQDAEALESNPEFDVLKSEPEFQKLLSKLKQSN
jgi:dienelactone hydrolase